MSEKEIREHQESLTTGTRAVLDKTKNERIQKAQEEAWIPYPAAVSTVDELELLFNYPKKDRMPNLLIVGDTNNGKTTILKRFMSMHPSFVGGGRNNIPIIYISAPVSPSPNALYEKILDALAVPYGVNESSSKKSYQVLRTLENINTRILIIDEMQDIYHGSMREQTKFLTALKQLGNELQIPIIAAGVHEVQRTLSSDPQIANRFDTIRLYKWNINEDFAKLVMSFEKMMPLKEPSNLIRKSMLVKLHNMCEGSIGELAKILSKAAVYALQHNLEKIDTDILDSILYIKPSDRRK